MFLTGGLPSANIKTEKEIMEQEFTRRRHSSMFSPLPDDIPIERKVAIDKEFQKQRAQYKAKFTPLPNADMTGSEIKTLMFDTFTVSEPPKIGKVSKKTNIFKSITKFFSKLFKKTPKI